tara:strand:+ start:2684 stop:3268 length:585 start_codon:yes stop_codon:yes gene_type:complete
MYRKINQFRRCDDGSAVIEFAIVAPLLFYIMLAIVEFGLLTFSMVVVESATNSSARYIRTGYNPGASAGLSLQDFVREDIKERTSGLINADRVFITTDLTSTYDELAPDKCLANPNNPNPPTCPGVFEELNGQPGYQGGTPALDPGGPNDIIKIQTYYRWSPLTGFQYLFFEQGDDDPEDIIIRSVTFIKNEPA